MIKDGFRVYEGTTTTGTGPLTLFAQPGFNTFSSALSEGDKCFYTLETGGGASWECGIGTFTGGLLARTTVLQSSTGAILSLPAGTHKVSNGPFPGYATGAVNYQDLPLKRAELTDYSETVASPAIAAGVLTLDIETGNVFTVAHNANITSLLVTSPSVSGKSCSFTLILTQDATGGRTLTIPASWVCTDGGTAPALSTTANKRNKLVVQTLNGGVEYEYSLAGKGY